MSVLSRKLSELRTFA